MDEDNYEMIQFVLEQALAGENLCGADAKLLLDNYDHVKLKHSYFTSNEWVRGSSTGSYVFEDGVRCDPQEFWYALGDDCRMNWDATWSVYKV